MKKSGCQLELRDPAHWGRQMERLGKQKAAYIMEDRPFLWKDIGRQEEENWMKWWQEQMLEEYRQVFV